MPDRIIVCGGRDYTDKQRVYDILNIEVNHGDTIIQGGATGVDDFAKRWAKACLRDLHWALVDIDGMLEFPADWKTHGRAAGAIRNRQMLKEGRATRVIAFPGGPGTRLMVNIARSAGVETTMVDEVHPRKAEQ